MAALDPAQAFGNLQAGGMKAPVPAQLSPNESVATASLIGQAHARVGESIGDLATSVERAMTFAEKQRHDTMMAQVERDVAQGEIDLANKQAQSGTRWAADELAKQHQQMLNDVYGKARASNNFSFLGDDVDRYKDLWLEKQTENYTRRVIQPRIAEDISIDLDSQSSALQQAAQAKLDSGDVDGAVALVHKAASVYDTPQAAIAQDNPLKRQQIKQSVVRDGYARILAQLDPNRGLELINNQLNMLKATDGQTGSDSMFAGMSQSDIVAMRDTLMDASVAQHKLANAQNKDRAVQEMTIMEAGVRSTIATAEANGDLKTFTATELQLKDQINKFSDPSLATDPAAMERLKTATSLLGHLQSSRQQMLDRAERRAQHNETVRLKKQEQEDKYLDETREVRDSVATGIPIDVNSSASKTSAQKYFDKEVKPQADGNPAAVSDFIAKTGYVPQHVSNRIARDVMSDDPAVVARGIDTMNQVMGLNGNAVKTLPKGVDDIFTDYQRGLSPQEIIEQRKRNALMSDHQKTIVKNAGNTEFGAVFGTTYSKQSSSIASTIKDVTGVKLDATPQVVESYKDAYLTEYTRTQDANSAAAVAAKRVTGNGTDAGFGRTSIGGVSATVQGAPEAMYDFVDGEQQDFDQQVRTGLQSVGLSGHEKYLPVFYGKNKDGQPLYQINTVDEHGQQFPVVNEDGTKMVFQYDRWNSTRYATSVAEHNQKMFEQSPQGKQYAQQQEMERRQQVKQQIQQRSIEAQSKAPIGPNLWK